MILVWHSFQSALWLDLPKVSYKLRDHISNVASLPLKNVNFRATANDIYGDYVHIYTDGSKDPISG